MHDRPKAQEGTTINTEELTTRRLVLLLLFATGLSALVYQVIWLRALATVFGSTTYATTTVLSAFMGGLALGSYLFGKMADRAERPLMLYGLLEIGVGAFALLFPLIMRGYDDFFVFLQQKTSWSFYGYSLVRFLACGLLLVIPTTLMGGTFPVISRFYVRRFSNFTANVSLLYGLNTFGAFIGVVIAGFFLIEKVGLLRTSLIAVSVNFGAGLAAIALQRVAGRSAGPADEAADAKIDTALEKPGAAYGRVIIAVVLLSGLASLAYEVIWTRTLIFVLDSFVYSFSIMLATFLTGIALGSLALSQLARKIKRGHVILAIAFVCIGLSALATVPFFSELTTWKKEYLAGLSENVDFNTPPPWGKYIMFKFLVSSLIMIIPTLLMGVAFPLALRLYSRSLDNIGRKIGTAYAYNTVGAILGSFIAGFILIPLLGLRNALIAVAGVSVMTGMVLLAVVPAWSRGRRLIWTGAPVLLFVVVVVLIPTDVYQRIFQKAQKDFELVYYDEDPTATVTAHKRGERVIININGLNVAGTGFNFLTTQKMQAHLAMLLHPGVKRVLQVGFGSGGTCYAVSLHDGIENIDCVELCEGVIKAAGHFIPSNHDVLKNPKVHLTIEDARNYVLATTHKYDLILSDSVHPTYAGNGTLYSRDYFALCKKILNPGGFVSFWMPSYLLSETDYKTIVKTFQSEFPYVMIWYVNNAIEAYTIIIGRAGPIEIDVQGIRHELENPRVARDLAQIQVFEPNDILGYFVMGPEKAREFAREGAINSDDHPVIEFRAPRSMSRRRTWYRNLKALSEMRESPIEFITHAGETEEETAAFAANLKKLFDAVTILIQGQLINISSYNFEEEFARYDAADKLYPDDPAIRRLKALATSRVMTLRGEKALREGQPAEAHQFFERAIAANPDPYDDSVGHAHYRMAFIDVRQGDVTKARQELSSCLAIYPNHKGALVISAILDLRSGNRLAARQVHDRLVKLYGGDDEVKQLGKRIESAN